MLHEARMGYCPFFSKCESQYNKLYCDTGLDRQGLGDGPGGASSAHDRPRYGRLGHDTTTTRPAARARGLAGGLCRDTQFCIVIEARDWPLGVVSRYNLCIVTGWQSG